MVLRVLIVVLGLSLALCSGVSVHAEEITLRVGVISGLTGAAAKWSGFQNKGMVLAQEELQSEGVQIELIFEDAQTSAPKVITAFNKLVQLNKVDAVIADDFGFVIAPILPLAERRKIPVIACSLPQEHYCAQAPKYFFSVGSQVPRSIAAYDRFFELHPEVKRIGLVVFDDPEWGNEYLALWREVAKKRGVTIVDTFLNNEWQPDFKSALTRMLPKKPQAIFFAHEPEGMIKAARQLRFTETIVAANNILEMLADGPAARPELDGVYLVDIPVYEEFRTKYRSRFKTEPVLEAYAGYEAVRALAKAARVNRADLASGMRSVRYQGVAGEVDFTRGSCAGNLATWELYRFVGGERVKQ